jgi:hypothetical protein
VQPGETVVQPGASWYSTGESWYSRIGRVGTARGSSWWQRGGELVPLMESLPEGRFACGGIGSPAQSPEIAFDTQGRLVVSRPHFSGIRKCKPPALSEVKFA